MINVILKLKSYYLKKRKSYFINQYEKYLNNLKSQQTFCYLLDLDPYSYNKYLSSELSNKYKNKIISLSEKIDRVERLL